MLRDLRDFIRDTWPAMILAVGIFALFSVFWSAFFHFVIKYW